MWREGLGCYKIVNRVRPLKGGYSNHPAVKEFKRGVMDLYNRLQLVRNEMLKRGYHPKAMPKYPIIHDEVMWCLAKPWQTLKQQKEILKAKGCKCKV